MALHHHPESRTGCWYSVARAATHAGQRSAVRAPHDQRPFHGSRIPIASQNSSVRPAVGRSGVDATPNCNPTPFRSPLHTTSKDRCGALELETTSRPVKDDRRPRVPMTRSRSPKRKSEHSVTGKNLENESSSGPNPEGQWLRRAVAPKSFGPEKLGTDRRTTSQHRQGPEANSRFLPSTSVDGVWTEPWRQDRARATLGRPDEPPREW